MLDASHFFSRAINYAACNEDGRSEATLMADIEEDVLVICGGGERAFDLLSDPAKRIERMTVLDGNLSQLHLFELKRAAIIGLQRDQFLGWIGIMAMAKAARRRIYQDMVRPALPDEVCRTYWDRHIGLIASGVIYAGQFERFTKLMSIGVRLALGRAAKDFFKANSLAAQRTFFAQRIKGWRWELLMQLLCRRIWFRLLTSDPALYAHSDIDSYHHFLRGRIESALQALPARHNFLMSLLFLGRYCHEHDVLPSCYLPGRYEKLRAALQRCRPRTAHGTLTEYLQQGRQRYSFMSLSDVPSYLKGRQVTDFAQTLARYLEPEGTAVVRELFSRHAALDGKAVEDCGLSSHEDLSGQLDRQDTSFIYRFHVYRSLPVRAAHRAA